MTVPETLREKYAAERDTRLRPENLQKWVSFREPELADMDRDLNIDYEALRSRDQPLENGSEVQVLIVGAGIHGVVMAHRLVTEGGVKSEDLVLVDRAGGYGGTWYWNRYPGVMCDVEGYCYLPLLEETGYVPSKRYPTGDEIREQCERVARHSNLRGQFGTTTTHHQWDEASRRWVVEMERGTGPGQTPECLTVKCQFLITAGGVHPSPQIPRLNGLNVFRSVPGKQVIHTARWDWELSGGSQAEPDMVHFKDKTVGIIGTGATAVQVVPHMAKWAKQVYVFQRTPAYVGEHSQRETTEEYWQTVAGKPGWQRERQANLDAAVMKVADTPDLVQDGWSQTAALAAFVGREGKIIQAGEEEAHERALVDLDTPWAEKMRRRIDEQVKDPAVAARLKPWYPGFCKRPTFHNSYLSAFNEPHVTLVDTQGAGVRSYTANGVMANGREYELDVLVLATGYTNSVVDPSPELAVNAPILGRGRRTLQDKFGGKDFGTLFGALTHGFPNLFFCTVAGTGLSANLTPALDTNAWLVAHVVSQALRQASSSSSPSLSPSPRRAVVEVSKQAEDGYSRKVAERARWFSALYRCTPNSFLEDKIVKAKEKAKRDDDDELERRKACWGGGILDFQSMVDEWTKKGDMEGVVVQC
ncbi:Putative FAD/NAD(P)-binding domain superfamily [Colletotrichum destructivum]|uniref:FAD/NAD(P)-binding domain superfamily n=1 Tax=Colletotrichum destructivum TaxID=34406 RepID=A0AAX4I7L0_9PEZI|nr:Putative FAD/NAD(P)-binding domain superfamily [Colletotrichum destructivum]